MACIGSWALASIFLYSYLQRKHINHIQSCIVHALSKYSTRTVLRILPGKIHSQIKGMNMGVWVFGTTNQLFMRGSLAEAKFSKQ